MYSYATHIFDGLDDWPTHLHYLRNTGCTGWQGRTQELQLYRDLRARGEPSPLLRIAEHWLRQELGRTTDAPATIGDTYVEAASGEGARSESGGWADKGFSAGRMGAYANVGFV